jgi:phage gp29-like protein
MGTQSNRKGRSRARERREALAAKDVSIKVGDLLKEQGRPSVTSVLSPWRDSEAEALTPKRLASLMRDADQGDVEAYLILAEEMEEREPHYRSVLSTRRMAVAGAPVTVEAASDDANDRKIAEFVEEIVKRPEFEGLVLDLMDGVGKGFSCVEIMWKREARLWEPTAYLHRPQRHFVFDTDTMSRPLLRAQEANGQEQGVELAPYKWLVHAPKLLSGVPVRTGLARTVAICYAAKRFTLGQWMTFLEVYGMPARVGKYPSDMKAQKKELLRVVQRMGTDAAAVIPKEMDIELLERKVGTGAGDVYLGMLKYWDQQVSKVTLGQTMTSDDGSSQAQALVHDKVRNDIAAADERATTATVNRDLTKPLVDLNFGPQKRYPKVLIRSEEKEDVTALMTNVKTFVDLGGRVQESEIRDRLGLSEPEPDAELLQPSARLAAPADEGVDGGDAPSSSKKSGKKGAANEDEKITKGKSGGKAELNRATFAEQDGNDVVDELGDERLTDWRPLLDENVGQLVREVQEAESYTALVEKLDDLALHGGEELAVKLVTANLARATFAARGVGDATDDVIV